MEAFGMLAVYLTCLSLGANAQFVELMRMEEIDILERPSQTELSTDIGHAVICGPPNVAASITWSPKTPNRHQNIDFAANITAPVNVSSGVLAGEVFMSRVKQKIFEFTYPFTCEGLIKKKVKITCPIKKSDNYYVPFTGDAGELPMGSFRIEGKVKNQHDEEFLCFSLNITITD
ncbi:uncharacterized protein [Argopecten irradians]|uniref:uncharacterized protein n=1 Tax=Argopecten irradians TaxID=31199 RepID=UPI003713037D